MSSPHDQIKVIQDYFRLADQGRPEILELFHEDAEIYFPKFGFGLGRQSLFEMMKGFEGSLEFIQHDYDKLKFIPAGDYVVVEGTSHGKLSEKPGLEEKLLVVVFATSSNLLAIELQVSISILIPTTPERMPRDLDGARIVNGEIATTRNM